MSKQLVVSLAFLGAALFSPRDASAQLAPTGAQYAGRPSDTGFTGPTEGGGFGASVPLDLPAARGGLPIPLQITSGAKGFGAAGVGWDIPLSFVHFDNSFAHRRPVMAPGTEAMPRERITLSLPGRRVEMLPVGDHWVGRYAADVTMRKVAETYVVADAAGLLYTFVTDVRLAGTGGHLPSKGGLWLLDSISGPGGSLLKLRYEIQSVDLYQPLPPETYRQPSPSITIDLIGISYNPGSSPGCFKHEISINYDGVALRAKPQALSVMGERVIARLHKASSIDVAARATCSSAAERLRRYNMSYLTDPDTQQARLSSVAVAGRAGTTEATVSLPVVEYQYGSATMQNAGARVLRYQRTPNALSIPATASSVLAGTIKLPTLFGDNFYGGFQSLADFTGDGLPDLVFTDNGHLSIAAGKPGLALGQPTTLNSNALTDWLLDERSSSVARFSDETSATRNDDYTWTQSIDVNGDGRIDVINAMEQPNTWVVYLNTPDAGPSGIRWQRRTYDVSRLRGDLIARHLGVPPDYLPLGHRVTGRNTISRKCWQWDDTLHKNVEIDLSTCWFVNTPFPVQEQKTYTEYEIKDINGDGYPDFLANSKPVTWVEAQPPTTVVRPYQVQPHLTEMRLGSDVGSNSILVFMNVAGSSAEDDTDPFSTATTLAQYSECGIGLWKGNDIAAPYASFDRMQNATCSITDINGDGLADFAFTTSKGIAQYYLGTGHGFETLMIPLPSHWPQAQRSDFIDSCVEDSQPEALAYHTTTLRDLTGDGIPDYITTAGSIFDYEVYIGTGAGFDVNPVKIEGPFSISISSESCNGELATTKAGLYDMNGDGRPDVVGIGPSGFTVSQLLGPTPGNLEAGRITSIANGYGATTTITYGSAKDEPTTRHQVPFPEIVTTSVRTKGEKSLGGTLAATRYAYGDIGMFFDSTVDAFRSTGYLRRVELVSTSEAGKPANDTAQIVDSYPLDPVSPLSLQILTDAQRFGRYLRVGRPRDVTTLAGSLGVDANALLSVDINSDPRRTSSSHSEAQTSDTHVFFDTTVPPGNDCVDMAFPYDAHLSRHYDNGTYKPCVARGFLLTQSTLTWRGSAGPPSSANVQTATAVRSADDFGRPTSVLYQNDVFRTDDDVCVDTTYATPIGTERPALTAVASRKVWACTKGGAVLAEESWEYDGWMAGFASVGLPTSHTVYRHAGDTGAYLSTVRQFDATYDALGNPVRFTSKREDGATRTVRIGYDDFGLFSQSSEVNSPAGPPLVTSHSFDLVTGDLLETTDPNGTARGTTFDGFGRPLLDTISTPEARPPTVLSARSYVGFDGSDADGRRIVVKEFTDPVSPEAARTSPGRRTTTYLDADGSPRFCGVGDRMRSGISGV